MPKVSVVVPVYNVEKYIEQCARSLFEQTLDDIEYIFVDDKSSDKSIEILGRILKEYPDRKPQCIIHTMEENSGQAAVRKWGIEHAIGDYIIHCDSDDWVEHDMYSLMYEKAKMEDADIVICDFVLNNGRKECSVAPKIKTTKDYQKGILTKAVHCSTWNKFVRRELYSKPILYPKENYAEDLAIMGQLFYYAKKIEYIPEGLYHYRYNPSSISKQKGKEKLLLSFRQTCSNAALVERFYQDKGIDHQLQYALDSMKCFERDRLIVLTADKEYYQMWKNTFPEINKRILNNPYISWKNKLRYVLVRLHIYPLYAKWRGLVP